jgi:hypothetical protein
MDELVSDGWREDHPFSPEMAAFQEELFDPALTRARKAEMLTGWCASGHYPCMFGRIAAKKGMLSVLILEERDLLKSDEAIGSIIADARAVWQDDALHGTKHALVVLAVSRDLAYAKPDASLFNIGRRLCELYLRRPVSADCVFRDEVFLQIFDSGLRRRWEVGVDNFAAQGDGRWWHHHRIPGGLGFSMNSVGHMVRTLVETAIRQSPLLRERTASLTREKLIQFALPQAMRTILAAQQHPLAGTCLKPRSIVDDETEIELQQSVAMKGVREWDVNGYEGWYHTDYTIRSEFFDADSRRPDDRWQLDFSYLHAKTELDYMAMSLGQEILAILGME